MTKQQSYLLPENKLPVEIVLAPEWWHKNEGMIFDRDFFFHPAKRVESEQKMEKILFLAVSLSFLWFILYKMSHSKEKMTFCGLFFGVLLSFLAFYLFQYGKLGSFSIKALSAAPWSVVPGGDPCAPR